MAVLIIALFVIVVAWGWYLVPKKTGAHKSSRLNVRGREFTSRGRQPEPTAATRVSVAPVAGRPAASVRPVPSPVGSGASARRRRVRTVLVSTALVTVAAALYTGSVTWWWVHLAVDGLLVIYYGLSMQLQQNRTALFPPTAARPIEESRPTLRKVVGG